MFKVVDGQEGSFVAERREKKNKMSENGNITANG
jgi:hypothetical protein